MKKKKDYWMSVSLSVCALVDQKIGLQVEAVKKISNTDHKN